ncbi:transcriptional regulator [Nocardia sp. KC 131]|uniref:transcriptional regulator n=1 Tax=Nocardia arseniciresistens TaxID=3392119 RepID=UPI00398ED3FD
MASQDARPAVFDEIIHPPNRLRLCAILAGADLVEFATARDVLDVSDSVLSKQVKILRDAGYVRVVKKVLRSRPQTWLGLTAKGKRALNGHLAELNRLSAQVSGDL